MKNEVHVSLSLRIIPFILSKSVLQKLLASETPCLRNSLAVTINFVPPKYIEHKKENLKNYSYRGFVSFISFN